MDIQLLKEIYSKSGEPARRGVVDDLVRQGQCSERKACALVGMARSTQRYARRIPSHEGKLRKAIRRIANRFRRYGYRHVTALLRRKGWRVNLKRVHRLWMLEGLGLGRKRPKRRVYGLRGAILHKAEPQPRVDLRFCRKPHSSLG